MLVTAAVTHANKAPQVLEEVELAAPQGFEVLVRIVASGICGSDLTIIDKTPLPWPSVLGHEGAGVVEKVGDAVTTLKPGDHVVMTTASCGICDSCKSANPSYCSNFLAMNLSGGRRADGSCTMHLHGEPIFGAFMGQSAFAAYALASERNAIKIDDDLPLDIMAPFGCGVQTGAAAVLNTLRVQAGKSVAVFGAGAVGLSALMTAKIAGCGPLIAVDTKPERLALARELGAHHVINAAEEDAVAAVTELGGVDYAVEATGIGSVMESAIRSLANHGQAALVGIATGQSISIEPTFLQSKGLTVKGSLMAAEGGVPSLFVNKLIGFWREGRLPVEKMIRRYDFDQINEAMAAAKDGSVIKPVLRLPG